MYFFGRRTHCIDLCLLLRSSLRKQPTFRDDTTGFPGVKWHLRNVCNGSAYRLSKFPRGRTNQNHYPELGSDTSSVWNFCARMSDVISWGKPVVASRNVGCFLRLVKKRRACLKTLVGYCSSECLLHFWSLFHHPKTLWCLRIPWITFLFGWVVIHQINLLLK